MSPYSLEFSIERSQSRNSKQEVYGRNRSRDHRGKPFTGLLFVAYSAAFLNK